jgi:tight adherence protein B
VRALVVFVAGVAVTMGALRAARRYAALDRLPTRRRTRLVPVSVMQWLAQALERAAVDVSAPAAMQLWFAAMAVAALLGFAFDASAAGCVAGGLSVALGAPVILQAARGRRARLVAASVPPAVDRVAAELRTGGTIGTAITALAHGDGVLAPDFARVDARVRLGATTAAALRAWARERDAPGTAAVAGALAMCAAIGGRAADALEGLASSLRDRLAVAAEARALSAQARMSAIVVGGAPLLYVAWSALADRRAVHALVATTTGRACVALGLGLELAGIWWMRRIVRAGQFL